MSGARIGALLVALFLVGAVEAQAQGRGRANSNNSKAQGNGPAFCRSGAGHPVHGWAWCREKGWDRAGVSRVDRNGRVIDRDGRVIDRDGRVIDRDGRIITRDGGIIVPDSRDGDIAIPRRVPLPRRDDDRDDGGWWPF